MKLICKGILRLIFTIFGKELLAQIFRINYTVSMFLTRVAAGNGGVSHTLPVRSFTVPGQHPAFKAISLSKENGAFAKLQGEACGFAGSRLTAHGSRLTAHGSRLTIILY
jgi:hypothetical protein